MAYFDSPKNRAIWNKELSALKEEREARAEDRAFKNANISNIDGVDEEVLRELVAYEQMALEDI